MGRLMICLEILMDRRISFKLEFISARITKSVTTRKRKDVKAFAINPFVPNALSVFGCFQGV